MAVFQTKYMLDETNSPHLVYLNDIDLPIDVTIGLNGEKIIATSQILDGAAVFERISRKPFEINFDFNFRLLDPKKIRALNSTNMSLFPADDAYTVAATIWEPAQVIKCQNTFLNKLGILNVIVKSITFQTVRGSTTLPCSLKCLEMFNSPTQPKSLVIDFSK